MLGHEVVPRRDGRVARGARIRLARGDALDQVVGIDVVEERHRLRGVIVLCVLCVYVYV